jgi:hypothetical protein
MVEAEAEEEIAVVRAGIGSYREGRGFGRYLEQERR